MMKNYGKRFVAFACMLMLSFTAMFGNVNMAKATEVTDGTTQEKADEYTMLKQYAGTATGGEEELIPFTVEENNGLLAVWYVTAPCNAVIGIVDSANYWYEDSRYQYAVELTASDWYYDEEDDLYGYLMYVTMPAPSGDYYIALETEMSVEYAVGVAAFHPLPSISQTSLSMSVGAKQKLTVDNTDEKITWKSSKKSVVKVNKKGVLTAKKEGTASITATLESGMVLKCKVTVKANKYTEQKLTAADMSWEEEALIQVYEGYYDSKGNLVAKCRFVNNSGYVVTGLENIELKVVGSDNKLIGSGMIKAKNLEILDTEVVDFTLTIQKSSLRNAKADLRNAEFNISCDYYVE